MAAEREKVQAALARAKRAEGELAAASRDAAALQEELSARGREVERLAEAMAATKQQTRGRHNELWPHFLPAFPSLPLHSPCDAPPQATPRV